MQDARTTIHDIQDDEFQDDTLSDVRYYESKETDPPYRGWEISFTDGGCFFIEDKYGVEPHTGDAIRTYGRGFGYVIRGIAIEGTVLYHRSIEQQRAKDAKSLAEHKRKMRQEYDDAAEQRAQTYVLLPQIFQERMAKMRENKPNFWEIEPYELFVCQQAMVFAEALGSPERVQEFYQMTWEEQMALVPGMEEGHSGNTFGAACHLASLYLQDPEYILRAHAAISPLLGCEDAGCHTAADFEQNNALAVIE